MPNGEFEPGEENIADSHLADEAPVQPASPETEEAEVNTQNQSEKIAALEQQVKDLTSNESLT